MAPKDQVKALVFDVFGTVVDWRGTLIRELTSFGNGRGIGTDWPRFADDWRGLYQPSMSEVPRRPTRMDDPRRPASREPAYAARPVRYPGPLGA